MNNAKPSVEPTFFETQHRFTQYIRQPDQCPAPADVEQRRMDVYKDLFANNIKGFLADNFPVIQQMLDDDTWQTVVRDFFAHHPCHSPYFTQIPDAFIGYLQSDRAVAKQLIGDHPYILELAHYEWVELLVAIAEDDAPSNPALLNNDSIVSLSQAAYPLSYQYPVHTISPTQIPNETPEQPTFLMVYRNHQDEVVFLETNLVTHALLERIDANGSLAAQPFLTDFAHEISPDNPQPFIDGGFNILSDFAKRGIITLS